MTNPWCTCADSEAQFQDFLRRIPSTTTLASLTGDQAQTPDHAASAEAGDNSSVPRVPSLDFIRAFLSAKALNQQSNTPGSIGGCIGCCK